MENLTKNRINLDTSHNSEEVKELDWITVSQKDFEIESFSDKLVRKTKENPAVPIGATATIAALVYGLWNFHKGNRLMSQYMMRARVAAQGFTILSIAVGFLYVAKHPDK